MKIVAWVGGLVVLGGLIVLAVAGISGATAILVTVAALIAMIALGGVIGGRHTPNVRPTPAPGGTGGSEEEHRGPPEQGSPG
jgi:hypothetical protein